MTLWCLFIKEHWISLACISGLKRVTVDFIVYWRHGSHIGFSKQWIGGHVGEPNFNYFLIWTLSFAPINWNGCRSGERKGSISDGLIFGGVFFRKAYCLGSFVPQELLGFKCLGLRWKSAKKAKHSRVTHDQKLLNITIQSWYRFCSRYKTFQFCEDTPTTKSKPMLNVWGLIIRGPFLNLNANPQVQVRTGRDKALLKGVSHLRFGVGKCHMLRDYLITEQLVRLTLAAESDTPWATFKNKPPTLPLFTSPSRPDDTSFISPMGLPRKSTEATIAAAWLRISC